MQFLDLNNFVDNVFGILLFYLDSKLRLETGYAGMIQFSITQKLKILL